MPPSTRTAIGLNCRQYVISPRKMVFVGRCQFAAHMRLDNEPHIMGGYVRIVSTSIVLLQEKWIRICERFTLKFLALLLRECGKILGDPLSLCPVQNFLPPLSTKRRVIALRSLHDSCDFRLRYTRQLLCSRRWLKSLWAANSCDKKTWPLLVDINPRPQSGIRRPTTGREYRTEKMQG